MTEEQQSTLNTIRQEVAICNAKIETFKSIIDPLRASVNEWESRLARLQYLKNNLQKSADAITISPAE